MRSYVARRWPRLEASCAILVWGCAILSAADTTTNSTSVASVPTTTFPIPIQATVTAPPECTAPGTVEEGNPEYDTFRINYGVFNLSNQADADALSHCTTLYGHVLIQSDTVETITLSGIEEIDGNLEISNCSSLGSISAPVLNGTSYTNNFTLSNLPLLTTLDIPVWSNVISNVYWDSLPLLTQINIWPLRLFVGGDFILTNAGLNTTSYFNFTDLGYYNSGTIQIRDNPHLNDIVLDNLAETVANLEIANNDPLADVNLPDLDLGGNISISNANSLKIPVLGSVSGFLKVFNNSFDLFIANVSSIGGDFIFSNNDNVEMLILPSLRMIGDYESSGNLVVESNARLRSISLPSLTNVYSNINLAGMLSNVSMPTLAAPWGHPWNDPYETSPFQGSFHLNSTASDLDCTYFDHVNYVTAHPKYSWDEHGIDGYSYSCQAVVPGTTKDRAKHWKPPYHFPKGGKIALILVASIIGAFFALVFLRWWYRRELQSVARLPAARNGIPLETVGDGLPPYRRVGKPGEVPPGYHVTHEVRAPSSESASPANGATVGTETVTPPVDPQTHVSQIEGSAPEDNANGAVAIAQVEPLMRERNLFGKIWYGRAPVRVSAGKRNLWARIWES